MIADDKHYFSLLFFFFSPYKNHLIHDELASLAIALYLLFRNYDY